MSESPCDVKPYKRRTRSLGEQTTGLKCKFGLRSSEK